MSNSFLNPSIAIILIIHGEPAEILKTILSLHNQTYKGKLSIICLDDGTSPKAKEILKNMKVKLYELPYNCNISYAKNFGLKVSPHDLVFFLDDHIFLEEHSIDYAIEVFNKYPHIAGVCGFYRSANIKDYNILRDIKRETIYGKSDKERIINRKHFTTLSTGIAIIKKHIFEKYNLYFPDKDFANAFGGEDLPPLFVALHHGLEFIYTPKIIGIHEHNLNFKDFIEKVKNLVRGRYSILYWASNNPSIEIPYLYGFLNFPYLFVLFLIISLPLSFIRLYWLLLPLFPLAYEAVLSLQCLNTPIKTPIKSKLEASIFVFMSDLLSIVYALQYVVLTVKRTPNMRGIKRLFHMNNIFMEWELVKYHNLILLFSSFFSYNKR